MVSDEDKIFQIKGSPFGNLDHVGYQQWGETSDDGSCYVTLITSDTTNNIPPDN
jgi:hypothetical protein